MSGYSSSGSDNGKPPLRYPPPPRMERRKPRNRKPALPPQEAVNEIWSKFFPPKFSKATNILPPSSHPNAKSSEPGQVPQADQTNLLVSEGFKKAAEECRTRVRKLVKECKRVNMRYRDPEFDIEWDLELGKGYYLNSLAFTDFRIGERNIETAPGPRNAPRSVKRVHRIFEKPTFMKEVSAADVQQGGSDNCWLMAALTALANVKGGIQSLCVEYDTKIGIYGFVFYRDGEWITSIIDDKLYVTSPDWDLKSTQRHLLEQSGREDPETEYRKTFQTGSHALYFARCRNQNETWLPLLEKAYAKVHGDYTTLTGGWIGEGIEDLTGGITTELLTADILDEDALWENELLKVNKDFLFGCATGLVRETQGSRDGIIEGHAYVIMEARQLSTGERLLKLRNPWGKGKKGNWEGPWSDGSKEFTPEVQRELGHKFASDSVFWISYEDLLRKYQHLDRTRLFADSPDWRINQKWISADVHWNPKFEARFTIVLTKESPLVLVLTQLDDRYFDGLQGQYIFRLQFRLHEVGSEGEDDFIMRSHGNYLMNRSVVAELDSLPAGTYTVFVMVTAERILKRAAAEEIIKLKCRSKADNEKLVQVGKSYDLAHSKAAAYMESRAKADKAKDNAKKREERVKARRRRWEKNFLARQAMRKQDKKNKDKRGRKEINNEARAKPEEETNSTDKAVQTDIKDGGHNKDGKAVQIKDVVSGPVQTDIKNDGHKKDDKAIQVGDVVSGPEKTDVKDDGQNKNDKSVQIEDVVPRPGKADLPPTSDSQPPMEVGDTGLKTGDNNISPSSPSDFQGMPDTPESSAMPGFQHPPLVRLHSSNQFPGPGIPPQRFFDDRHPQDRPVQRFRAFPRDQQDLHPPSDGESSASPVSDFEDILSEDERVSMARPIRDEGPPPRRGNGGPINDDSDFEDGPDPWNAICIVGLRAYSKDEGLKVKIYGQDDDEVMKDVEKSDDLVMANS